MWQKTIIRELLDIIDKLYDEKEELEAAKEVVDAQGVEMRKILERNELKNKKMMKEIVDVIEKRENKYKVVVAVLFSAWVFLVILMKG